MDAMYTTEALATGAGRNGHAAVTGSDLDFHLAIPKEMGGSGEGANPRAAFCRRLRRLLPLRPAGRGPQPEGRVG